MLSILVREIKYEMHLCKRIIFLENCMSGEPRHNYYRILH